MNVSRDTLGCFWFLVRRYFSSVHCHVSSFILLGMVKLLGPTVPGGVPPPPQNWTKPDKGYRSSLYKCLQHSFGQFWGGIITPVKQESPNIHLHLMICKMSVHTLPNMFHYMWSTWGHRSRRTRMTETKPEFFKTHFSVLRGLNQSGLFMCCCMAKKPIKNTTIWAPIETYRSFELT